MKKAGYFPRLSSWEEQPSSPDKSRNPCLKRWWLRRPEDGKVTDLAAAATLSVRMRLFPVVFSLYGT